MNIAFLGTGAFGVPTLRALLAAGHTLTVTISQPDRRAGRGLTVQPTPIRAAAEALGLRHVQAEDVNAGEADLLAGAELGVVVAFGQRLGPALLSTPARGMINLHGSLLPRFRGAAPYQWAILNGETVTGVTVFQVTERWDAGPVWSRRETVISESETADELHDRLAELGPEAVCEALARIASGSYEPTPQDRALASRAPKLSRADAWVDWSAPARTIVRRIHGLWSWPSAAATYRSGAGREERVQFARAAVVEERTEASTALPAGSVCDDLTVQAGRGRVRLLELKPAGGRLMSFEAFANGRRLRPGDRFVTTSG
jgi:methionyl-tRNA formyltransferase